MRCTEVLVVGTVDGKVRCQCTKRGAHDLHEIEWRGPVRALGVDCIPANTRISIGYFSDHKFYWRYDRCHCITIKGRFTKRDGRRSSRYVDSTACPLHGPNADVLND